MPTGKHHPPASFSVPAEPNPEADLHETDLPFAEPDTTSSPASARGNETHNPPAAASEEQGPISLTPEHVGGEPITARPLGAAERLTRWVRRKPTAAAAWGLSGLAVTLTLVVLVVVGFWRDAEAARDRAERTKEQLAVEKQQTEEARREAVNRREEAEKARAGEVEARKTVEREREKLAAFEYGNTMRAAHQEWRDHNIVTARALLEGTEPKLRGWEWHYLNRICDGSLLPLKGHTGLVSSASFSGDGSRVVTASYDYTARVWEVPSAWPEGFAKTGAEVAVLKGHIDRVTSASFSRDGSRVVTASYGKTARVWDAKTGAEVAVLKGHINRVTSASFSRDGRRVVTAGDDGTPRVWNAFSFRATRTPDLEPAPGPHPALRRTFSPGE